MMIKVFLIVSVLSVALFLMRGGTSGRHLAVRRLTAFAFACCWALAVIAPDVVTQVANQMGVGRGTDLVLYVLVVAFLFATVAQRQHLRELDDRIAALTRELALAGERSQTAVPRAPDPTAAKRSSTPND